MPSKGSYDSVGRWFTTIKGGPLGMRRTIYYDNLDRITDVVDSRGFTNYFLHGCCGIEYAKDRLGREMHYAQYRTGPSESRDRSAQRHD